LTSQTDKQVGFHYIIQDPLAVQYSDTKSRGLLCCSYEHYNHHCAAIMMTRCSAVAERPRYREG